MNTISHNNINNNNMIEYLEQYLEPNVQRHVGIIPPSVCQQLINLGEKFGFNVEEESIDAYEQNDPTKIFIPSQSIDIYRREPGIDYELLELMKSEMEEDEDEDDYNYIMTTMEDDLYADIENEEIWTLLQPYIPTITNIVKTNRDPKAYAQLYPREEQPTNKEPELNWIFFRKYSPSSKRNSLNIHHDTNMNTVNIELNDDYEGGGLVYVKPLVRTGEVREEYGFGEGYDWIDGLRRVNTSDLVFPGLRTGDAIFYNYTVTHGVAPVESGARYSMAFFFDMDNPAVDEDYDIYDDPNEFEVELHNAFPQLELDIVLIYDASSSKEKEKKKDDTHIKREEQWIRVFDDMVPDERTIYLAFEGDLIRAFVAGTSRLVGELEIEYQDGVCTVFQIGSVGAELFPK